MSEFTFEDLEGVISQAENSLVQMLALQLRNQIKSNGEITTKCAALAAELKQSQIDAGCYKHGMEASNARLVQVAAENAGLKRNLEGTAEFCYSELPETPATDAFLAEVLAQGLNAFIQHHSAELDAHIKNGGEQFDEKSVRIRDIIVSARLFREQIRKESAQ